MKKKQFNTILFLSVLFLPLAFALAIDIPQAHAAGDTLLVDPTDNPLNISGVLNGQTAPLKGAVRLTAVGGDITNLQLLASDLQIPSTSPSATPTPNTTSTLCTTPTPSATLSTIIDRGNISIPQTNLTNGQPKDVRVTVSNVIQPGNYQGILKFLIPGQKESDALCIPLILHIDIVPNVTPVLGAVSIQVVHDQVPWDDFFVSLFMSDSFKRDEWKIQLDNQTPAPVKITNVTVVMHGANNDVVLNSKEAQVYCTLNPNPTPPPCTLAANQVTSLDLVINRDMLPPDDYQGMLRYSLVNAITPSTVNVDLKVRNGPFWPLIVLIIGVLIGFIYQNMNTTLALKQLNLYPTYNQLKEKAKGIKDKDALDDVLAKLQDALSQINSASANATEVVVSKALDSIDYRIHIYLQLQQMKDIILQDIIDVDLKQKLVIQIQGARVDLETMDIQGDTTTVENTIKDIQKNVDDAFGIQANVVKANLVDKKLADDKTPALSLFNAKSHAEIDNLLTNAGEPLKTDFYSLRKAKTDIDSLVPGTLASLNKIKSQPRPQKFFKRLYESLLGSDGASFRYKVVRPVLGIILVIVLILIGLQTLYVSNGTTFGSAGLSDFLVLLLWGISAKVAQSTLQNLPPLPKS